MNNLKDAPLLGSFAQTLFQLLQVLSDHHRTRVLLLFTVIQITSCTDSRPSDQALLFPDRTEIQLSSGPVCASGEPGHITAILLGRSFTARLTDIKSVTKSPQPQGIESYEAWSSWYDRIAQNLAASWYQHNEKCDGQVDVRVTIERDRPTKFQYANLQSYSTDKTCELEKQVRDSVLAVQFTELPPGVRSVEFSAVFCADPSHVPAFSTSVDNGASYHASTQL